MISGNSWLIKYKLYHIPFWLVYHFIWTTIYVGDFYGAFSYLSSTESIKTYSYVVFQIIGVYFNLYYLIPRLLYRRAYGTYIIALIALIILCTMLITSGYYVAAYFSEKTFFEIFKRQPNEFVNIFLTNALPSTLASMTLAMSIKLGKNWLRAEKRQLTLEKEKLETELKYLKSQINPHFLFNTINSIFALIHKNPDLASESLANFSGMLRYQLYECDEEETELSKELTFLENFIDLEKLRLDEKQTELVFEIENKVKNGQRIAPFILIPFVENAFKYVSKGKSQSNFIRMKLLTDNGGLYMSLENSKAPDSVINKPKSECSGIGLKNVKRRLDLIYHDKYDLEISGSSTVFDVKLRIAW